LKLFQGSNLLREAQSKTHPPFRSREQITPFNATVLLFSIDGRKNPAKGALKGITNRSVRVYTAGLFFIS